MKNKIIYLIVLVLLIVAGYVYFNDKPGTIGDREGEKSDFVIEDTTTIDKIFMVDAQGNSMTLNKSENGWLVNNDYRARPDNIRLLMKTFGEISVKAPVPKAAFKTVVKKIATGATKVEIYQGGSKPSKTYYVGSATMDQLGTYMLLETNGVKSTVPFIMYIPRFRGSLTSRFFTDADQWRDAEVFKYEAKDIKRIALTYYETPEQSFTINKNGEEMALLDADKKVLKDFNEGRMKEYIERYSKIYYEMVDTESPKERIDSLKSSQPYFKIVVEDVGGDSTQLIAYHMPNFRALKDNQEVLFEYDVDRMYGYVDNKLFTFIQFATFDKLSIPKDDLLFKE